LNSFVHGPRAKRIEPHPIDLSAIDLSAIDLSASGSFMNHRLVAASLLALPLLSAPLGAAAQSIPQGRFFREVPDINHADPGRDCPRGVRSQRSGREVTVQLNVSYADYSLYNPNTDRYDAVHLRSYNGCPTGPVINLEPGTKLKVDLRNYLPASEPTFLCPENGPHDKAHCFNTVNLHTHGLHVSPSGRSDNVLLSIHPGQRFGYEYEIPRNHPAGTHWYHAHRHGSTAIQVSSGGAGVMIVRGNRRVQDKARNAGIADIDTILKDPRGRTFKEQVMLFQQIEYGCFDGPSSVVPIADPRNFQWQCAKGQKGEIRGYDNQLLFVPDPRAGHAGQFNSTWDISGRYTQINGVVQPTLPGQGERIEAGEIQRWRMVHGGVRDSINLKIVKADLRSLLPAGLDGSDAQVEHGMGKLLARMAQAHSPQAQQIELAALCKGEVVKQLEFALDGTTRTEMVEKASSMLHPGYRSDVLVAFPTPGLYCVLDEEADAASTINYRPRSGKVKDRRLLAFARVGRGPGVAEAAPDGYGHSKYWQHVRSNLLMANTDLPPAVKRDLQTLKTPEYAHIKAVPRPANTFLKPADTFTIDFNPATFSLKFGINNQLYDPARTDFQPVLGRTDEWTIGAQAAHIFHIHVNPFQIVDIKNPLGQSIYGPDGKCTAAELATNDTQYCDQQGVVRDTIFVKDQYQVVMRTKYEDYTGKFVMHCHILEHEDLGMMMNVDIVSPTRAAMNTVLQPLQTAVDGVSAALQRAGLSSGRRPATFSDTDICSSPIPGIGRTDSPAVSSPLRGLRAGL
jgi:FtsP/CotA-like multicopper oxidase with cupredoxin domain